MYRVSPFVPHFAWGLLGGAGLTTLWVNVSPATYSDAVEWRLADLAVPTILVAGPLKLTVQVFVNDVLMAVFSAFIGKEVWEAFVLRSGVLSGRQAVMPCAMTIGAMAGSVVAFRTRSGAGDQRRGAPASAHPLALRAGRGGTPGRGGRRRPAACARAFARDAPFGKQMALDRCKGLSGDMAPIKDRR